MKENVQGIIIILSRGAPSALRSASICLAPSLFNHHPDLPRSDSHRQIRRNFCFTFVLIFVEKEFSIFTSLPARNPRLSFGPFNFSHRKPAPLRQPR